MPAIRGYEALLMLAELVGRPVPPWIDFRPLSARRAITYERDGRRHGADLYQPEGRVRAGVVFVPGAVEQGKDDPRVVAFASALARSRFAVLVPDIVALRALRLLPDSAVDVADALALMDARKDLAPGGRLGLLTTSVGIGPAMITMLDPASGRHVRFFVSIGGYYDLPRTLAYLTTGHYEAHGVTRRDAPHDYGKWIYALSNAARLQNAAARSPELLEQLPSYLRADVDRLNLAASDLGWLPARFILVHGVGDNMIPYGESIGLAAALPPERTRLFLLTGFYHVEMAPQLVDGFRLWRAICALLAER
jgi:hypothetical protein